MIRIIALVLMVSCLFIIGSSFLKKDGLTESIRRGKEVYTTYCINCHMENGMGTTEVNPPLAKADYIKKPAKALIAIILEGQSGEIIVNKQKYNTIMPPQPYLSDEQVADVLNYVRNTWGNKVPGIIIPAQVKVLRK